MHWYSTCKGSCSTWVPFNWSLKLVRVIKVVVVWTLKWYRPTSERLRTEYDTKRCRFPFGEPGKMARYCKPYIKAGNPPGNPISGPTFISSPHTINLNIHWLCTVLAGLGLCCKSHLASHSAPEAERRTLGGFRNTELPPALPIFISPLFFDS